VYSATTESTLSNRQCKKICLRRSKSAASI
jgi:hypothetical protein